MYEPQKVAYRHSKHKTAYRIKFAKCVVNEGIVFPI